MSRNGDEEGEQHVHFNLVQNCIWEIFLSILTQGTITV